MKLNYVKINDKTYEFDYGVNAIIGPKNSGKTTLYNLIKMIYGGNSESFIDKIEPLIMKGNTVNIEWEFMGEKFVMHPESGTISNGKYELSYNEYKNRILTLPDYSIQTFGTLVKSADIFCRKDTPDDLINHKSNYGKFFNENKSFTHTTVTYLKLIGFENITNIENYFALVGKYQNLQNANRAQNRYKNEYSEEIIKLIEEQKSSVERYLRLKKISETKLNPEILAEIEKISKIKIEDVVNFHKKMISSFNNVVSVERENIQKELAILEGMSKNEVKEIASAVYDTPDRKNLIKEIKTSLDQYNEELDEWLKSVQVESEDMKKQILKYKQKLSMDDAFKFYNEIEYKKTNNSELLVTNLKKISLKTVEKDKSVKLAGDGYVTLNFLFYMIQFIKKTRYPIIQFEKKFFTEVDNNELVQIFKHLNSDLTNKQMFVYLHDDAEFNQLNIKVHKEKKFFGKDY